MSITGPLLAHVDEITRTTFPDARAFVHGELPDDPPPRHVTIDEIDTVHERHFGGGSGIVHPRWEFHVWTRRESEGRILADRLREAFDNLRGMIGVAGHETVVAGVFLDSIQHTFEVPADGSNRGWHRHRLDMVIWHPESETPVRR